MKIDMLELKKFEIIIEIIWIKGKLFVRDEFKIFKNFLNRFFGFDYGDLVWRDFVIFLEWFMEGVMVMNFLLLLLFFEIILEMKRLRFYFF